MCAALLLAGCPGKTEERQMGETIEMGPFAFQVENTTEEFWRSDKVIVVHLWLDKDKSRPFRKPFGDMIFGNMSIVDGAGNKFDESGLNTPSGSRLSASEFEVRFTIRAEAPGVRDREKLGDRPGDFKLVIKNPDRRDAQPGRVSVALH